jgi:hypothetical protein
MSLSFYYGIRSRSRTGSRLAKIVYRDGLLYFVALTRESPSLSQLVERASDPNIPTSYRNSQRGHSAHSQGQHSLFVEPVSPRGAPTSIDAITVYTLDPSQVSYGYAQYSRYQDGPTSERRGKVADGLQHAP